MVVAIAISEVEDLACDEVLGGAGFDDGVGEGAELGARELDCV